MFAHRLLIRVVSFTTQKNIASQNYFHFLYRLALLLKKLHRPEGCQPQPSSAAWTTSKSRSLKMTTNTLSLTHIIIKSQCSKSRTCQIINFLHMSSLSRRMNQLSSNLTLVVKYRVTQSRRYLPSARKMRTSCLFLCFTTDRRFWHLQKRKVSWRLGVLQYHTILPSKRLLSCLGTTNSGCLGYSRTISKNWHRKVERISYLILNQRNASHYL